MLPADPPAPGPGRTWPQRLLITFNCLLITGCLLGVGAFGYFYQRFDQVPRVALAAGVLKVEEAPGEPTNFLLVGSDSRAFTEGDEEAEDSFGSASAEPGQRSDTIILVRVDPQAETAAVVSFPRDLWVDIAGEEGRNRINTAFAGGPEKLIRTITQNFDIPIHNYVQVDFAGFKGLVDAVDGVEVYLAAPVRDRDAEGNNLSGLNITDSGCVNLSGDQALSYVRSRHYEELVGGRWRADLSGDIGRIGRQQDFMRRAMREVISRDLLNPSKVNELVDVGIDNVSIDGDLDIRDVVALGKRFRSLGPETLQQYSLPVEAGRAGQASVLFLEDGPEVEAIFDVFRGVAPGDPAAVQPSSVNVRVLNGTGVPGQAGEARDGLTGAGFTVLGVGDGAATEVTTIRYGDGQGAKAQLLARHLAGDVVLEADPTLDGVDAVVQTGATYVDVLPVPRPADEVPAVVATTTTTSTTAPASTTTTVPEC